jgi:Na+-transporting NADH:ubiquinone oxidoreductase subunit NqrD
MAIGSLTINAQKALTPFYASFVPLIQQFKSWFKPHISRSIGVFVGLGPTMLLRATRASLNHCFLF